MRRDIYEEQYCADLSMHQGCLCPGAARTGRGEGVFLVIGVFLFVCLFRFFGEEGGLWVFLRKL